MKRLILITALLFIVSCQQESKMDPNINPFFQEWNTPYEVPPFLDIKDEHYMPAYEQGMKENLEEIVRWKVRMTIYGSFFQRANLLDRYPAGKKVNYTLDDHDER